MKFSVITAFPDMIQQALQWGVVGKALEKQLFSLETLNPRDQTTDVHKTIDDRPYGGGDGMILLYEPLAKTMEAQPQLKTSRRIYLSPAGRRLDETVVKELCAEAHLTLLCGRYGGVDQRFLNHYGFENLSVGDYVVSGGELPALILIDAVVRKLPGALGHNESAHNDSFAQGPFFEAPLFTRPRQNEAGTVPDVLLSGDHKKIEEFRHVVGQALTLQMRPEVFNAQEKALLKKSLWMYAPEDLKIMGLQESFLTSFLGDTFGKN